MKLKGTFCHERLTQREFEFISDELEIASVGIEINERNYGVDLCKVSQTGGKYFAIEEASVPTTALQTSKTEVLQTPSAIEVNLGKDNFIY